MKYKTYNWFHSDSSRFGVSEFKTVTGFFVPHDGLDELSALKAINLWNTGIHHAYRYWI